MRPCPSHRIARAVLRAVLSILMLTGLAHAANASVPNPVTSTIPPCLAVCPQADIAYTVVIRDLANNPVNSANVVFDFSGCPNMQLCAPVPSTDYQFLSPTSISTTTNAAGSATIHLEAGGCCANAVKIYANGVLMTDTIYHPLVSVANADQSGDLFVQPNDETLIVAKSASDPTADLNCDGTHDAADNALLLDHLSHFCKSLIDPVEKHTWGQVKIRYR
jgi:hypothetical protein